MQCDVTTVVQEEFSSLLVYTEILIIIRSINIIILEFSSILVYTEILVFMLPETLLR